MKATTILTVAAVCILLAGCDSSTIVEPVSDAIEEQTITNTERLNTIKEENKETANTIRDMVVSAGRSIKSIVEDIQAGNPPAEEQ